MPKKKPIAFVVCMLLGACATSPLYKADPSSGQGTVPRDEMGEPLWDQIKPAQLPING